MLSAAMTPRRITLLVCITLYMALAGYVLLHFIMVSNLGDSWRAATVEGMVNGTAEKPYVYRLLIPKVIGVLVDASPLSFQQSMNQQLSTLNQYPLVKHFFAQRKGLEQVFAKTDQLYLRLVAIVVSYGCLLGYVWVLYKLAVRLLPGQDTVALITPIVGLLMVPALAYPTMYLYDMGVLVLSACCYYAIATHRWRWYYLWLVLACLNKESALFIILFFTVWCFGRLPRRAWIKHVLWQLAIFMVIKHTLYLAYLYNPGVFLATYYQPSQIMTLLRGYNYSQFAVFLVITVLLTYRWQQKPPFARYGLWVLGAMFIAYLFFGKPYEYRVFYDIVPLMAILVTHTLVALAAPGPIAKGTA